MLSRFQAREARASLELGFTRWGSVKGKGSGLCVVDLGTAGLTTG